MRLLILAGMFAKQERSKFAYFISNAIVFPAVIGYVATRMFPPHSALVVDWLIGTMCLGISVGSLMQTGFAAMTDQLNGRLKLLQNSAVRPREYMAAYLVSAVIWAVVTAIAVLSLLGCLAMLSLSPRLLAAGALLSAAVAVMNGSIGVLIGSRVANAEAGSAYLFVTGIVLGLAAPVLYRSDQLPRLLSLLFMVLPVALVAKSFKAVAHGQFPGLTEMLVLGAMTAAVPLICLRLLQWRP